MISRSGFELWYWLIRWGRHMNDLDKKPAYMEKLKSMTDEELFKECKDKIWLSAYASNNPRSCFHWQCDATYDEAKRREKVDLYSNAHKVVSSQ